MISIPGTIRSLKFSKSGNHLVAGNEYGKIVIFDVVKGDSLEIIPTFQLKAIWSMDISWDDSILAVGTETGTIELYNFQKIITTQTNNPRTAVQVAQTESGKAPHSSFIKLF